MGDVDATVEFLRSKLPTTPRVCIVCGSGLGSIAEMVENAGELPFASIPGFPNTSVKGHTGRLVWGDFAGKPTVVLSGRAHFYEGIGIAAVTFPARVMAKLGVEVLVLTNAAGAVNREFKVGDVMMVTDHISLASFAGGNPLVGPNDERDGPRFLDMTAVYNPMLKRLAREAARKLSFPLREGVYALDVGPCYETPAEVRMLSVLGADVVGMSTVPEATVAHHRGMKVVAFSTVSNMCSWQVQEEGVHVDVDSHEAVLKAVESAGEGLKKLLWAIVGDLA